MFLKKHNRRVTNFIPIVCVTWLLSLFIAFHHEICADEKILIAAAANLNPAMNDICKGFEKRYPDIDAEVSYGSSGNFFAQIKQGAPFDNFFLSRYNLSCASRRGRSGGKGGEYDLRLWKHCALDTKEIRIQSPKGIGSRFRPKS